MSTDTQPAVNTFELDNPLGDPLDLEDITPGTPIVLVREAACIEVLFVGTPVTKLEVDRFGRTSFLGLGYTPDGTASTGRWFLTENGVESYDSPAGSANMIYVLPSDLSPFDHDVIEGFAWARSLYFELARLQEAWDKGEITTDAAPEVDDEVHIVTTSDTLILLLV